MRTEASVQKTVKDYLREHGCLCEHLSPPDQPGFHDLLVVRQSRCKLIEIKDFGKIGPGVKMGKLFTEYQPSYYLKTLVSETPSIVVGCLKDEIYLFQISDKKDILDLFRMTRNQYLDSHGMRVSLDDWLPRFIP